MRKKIFIKKTVDSLEIREMLISLGNTTPCPACRTKIPSSGIEIIVGNKNFCQIKFLCPNCSECFSGYAQIIRKTPEELGNLNASSIVAREVDFREEVSKNEVQAVHSILEQGISFIYLFAQKNKKK